MTNPMKSIALMSIVALAFFALAGGAAQAQTATVTGTVVDAATGLPIEGAFVTIRPDGCTGGGGGRTALNGHGHGWGHHGGGGFGGGHHGGGGGGGNMIRVQTDANGVYTFENLEAGDWLVRACGCGYLPSDLIPVTLADGETVILNFELNLR